LADPRFSFVQINDTHVTSDDNPSVHFVQANERLAATVAVIAEGKEFPRPDFAVIVGDLVDGVDEDVTALSAQLAVAKSILDRLPCPYHPIIGNHDNYAREGEPRFERPFLEAFGLASCNYTFTHRGVRFVALDNTSAIGDVPARNAWLRAVLEKEPRPTVLLTHIPLVSFRDEAALRESFGFDTYRVRGEALLSLIEAHADQVAAVLCGHLHLTGKVQQNGIVHVSPTGTASWPCHAMHYTVYADRMEARVLTPPEERMRAATEIHGPPRHETAYVDSAHPEHDAYLAGNPDEQEFVIPLQELAAG